MGMLSDDLEQKSRDANDRSGPIYHNVVVLPGSGSVPQVDGSGLAGLKKKMRQGPWAISWRYAIQPAIG